MRRLHGRIAIFGLAVWGCLAVAAPAARQTTPAAAALRQAMDTETVKGDVAGAVAQYQALGSSPDRAVAAQALVRLGDLLVRQGQAAEARAAFQRVVSDFAGETPWATQAQARLAAAAAPAPQGSRAPGNRQLWTSSGDTVSADGRYISYVTNGVVFVHDVATNGNRRLTTPAEQLPARQYAEVSAISRDGRHVAYSWSIGPRYQLRVVPTDAGPDATPRILVDNPEIVLIAPLDWAPDGVRIVLRLSRADRTGQIAIASTKEPALTVLKSVDWRGPMNATFSPDGRRLAYDIGAEGSEGQRDILVIDADGASERALVTHSANDVVAGWTPDGRSLLFVSTRSGSAALWVISATPGPGAAPALVKSDLGVLVDALAVTRSGAFIYTQRTSAAKVFTADVDFATGRIVKPPAPVLETYLQGQRGPVWSADGAALAWMSPPPSAGQRGTVTTHAIGSGRSTTISPELSGGVLRGWGADGSLVYQGIDLKGRPGIFRVGPTDGSVAAIATSPNGFLSLPSWSADGKLFAYRHQTAPPALVLRDMASGTERNLVSGEPFGLSAVAPDGSRVAYAQPLQQPRTLRLLSLSTGEIQTALTLSAPGTLDSFQWLPDSQRLVVWRTVDGKSTGAVVSLDGRPDVPLDPAIPEDARVDPSGRRIAFSAGTPVIETWSLENFLPIKTAAP